MIAVFLGVPLLLLALVLVLAIWVVCSVLSALLLLFPQRRKKRSRRLPSAKIPGLYEPRWGAYRRGREARDKSQWYEDFSG